MKTTVLALIAWFFVSVPGFAQTMPYPAQEVPPADITQNAIYDPLPPNAHMTPSSLWGKPLHYASGEVLFWTRRLPSGPLFVNQYTGETTADFRDSFNSRWGAGPNITFGRELGDCWNIEATYFGIYGMELSGTIQPNRAQPVIANPNIPGQAIAAEVLPFPNFRAAGTPLLVFDPRDFQTVGYTTALNNFELNVRKNATDRFSWLFGLRYVSVIDELIGTLQDQARGSLGGYGINTYNNLFGGQIGADYTGALADPLYVRITGKAGLFGNAASQSTYGALLTSNAANQPLGGFTRTANSGQVSFLGQANLTFVYEYTPRVHFTAGYSSMVITGVATAPAQTTASNFAVGGAAGINTSANAFYHGMNFGIEYHH